MITTKADGKDFHGIGLVEILWKDITWINKQRLTAAIMYHYILYGLRTGRGTGTVILEAKLIHQLTAMREAVLHTVFLDLQN